VEISSINPWQNKHSYIPCWSGDMVTTYSCALLGFCWSLLTAIIQIGGLLITFVGKIYPCFALLSSSTVQSLCKFTHREGPFHLTVFGDLNALSYSTLSSLSILEKSMRRYFCKSK